MQQTHHIHVGFLLHMGYLPPSYYLDNHFHHNFHGGAILFPVQRKNILFFLIHHNYKWNAYENISSLLLPLHLFHTNSDSFLSFQYHEEALQLQSHYKILRLLLIVLQAWLLNYLLQFHEILCLLIHI